MPEVLREGVMTVFTSLPFQSTSHAASSGSGSTGRLYVFEFDAVIFCWPIHKPPGASVITASALGYMPGDLNIFVVFAVRVGAAPRPLPPPCASAITVGARGSARPAARNSLRFMLMASPLKGGEIPRERSAGVEADLISHNGRRFLPLDVQRDVWELLRSVGEVSGGCSAFTRCHWRP